MLLHRNEIMINTKANLDRGAKHWGGKPYYPISQFYKEKFGQKVYKIPVGFADDCPNRRGLRGMQTCVFCDAWGSAAYKETLEKDLRAQVELNKHRVRARYKGNCFLVYFQAYTTTFSQISKLQEAVEMSLQLEGVVGIVIGTRPDCVSPALLRFWKNLSETTFLAIEIGVQSFNDHHLSYMRRGHSAEESVDAILKIHEHSGADIGIHLIFGCPHETMDDIYAAAYKTSSLPVTNVKLHNLHVLKNTPLAELYFKGEFAPIELPEYAEKVGQYLRHIRPDIAVHRLGAYAQNWDELIAPAWANDKMFIMQYITDFLLEKRWVQGQCFG